MIGAGAIAVRSASLALIAGCSGAAVAGPAEVRPAPRSPAPARPAAASVPLVWQGVGKVGVACLVNTDRGVDTGPLRSDLCDQVRSIAAAGAPVPVEIAAIGGGALAPDTVTLLVHASVERIAGQRIMALSIRPFRNDGGGGVLFAAAPRAIALGDRATTTARLRDAATAMLADTLPWRSRPTAARALPH